jgi:biotin synthase
MDEIIAAINQAPSYVKRACISMITNGKCRRDTPEMAARLRDETPIPVSVLISPHLLDESDLIAIKENGVDKIGVAIDLATPDLFDKYRGKCVSGPHRWDKYWNILELGLKVFGHPHVGVHLMVGMGETEEQMVSLMGRLWQMGVVNHLFSFFAEEGSQLHDRPQPVWPAYLRVQLARYLIEEDLSHHQEMEFDQEGHILDLGLAPGALESIINLGTPFMTTGCLGPDGELACNRPFGNCLPDVKQWNYPYPPNEEELHLIRKNVFRIE